MIALLAVAIAAFVFEFNIGFMALSAAIVIQLAFPAFGAAAEKKIAWGVVLLVCGVVTYVAALQRYGTIQAAAMASPGWARRDWSRCSFAPSAR